MKTRAPVVRRGQRKPYCRGTQTQIAVRLKAVADLLEQGTRKTKIHEAIRSRFNIEWRQCDRYMARARALLFRRETRLTTPFAMKSPKART
jgi:hypothetical protein